jgi:hypothetical protein
MVSSDVGRPCLSAPLPRSALVGNADDARFALLARLVDHAPLFPPASMSLPEALAEDERARKSRYAFALARFVCPASKLSVLPDVGRGVSVVLDTSYQPDERVEAVELTLSRLDGLARDATEVYVEVPLAGELDRSLDRVADLGLFAKVRCGGASVVSSEELARFLSGCRQRGVVFKATAGLHHAVRTEGEHGILNLLAAVVFGDEVAALEEPDRDAFVLGRDAFRWRDRAAGAAEIAHARRERLRSIGSCSFFEPIQELEALGVLPL